jgi:hypothetical protein
MGRHIIIHLYLSAEHGTRPEEEHTPMSGLAVLGRGFTRAAVCRCNRALKLTIGSAWSAILPGSRLTGNHRLVRRISTDKRPCPRTSSSQLVGSTDVVPKRQSVELTNARRSRLRPGGIAHD